MIIVNRNDLRRLERVLGIDGLTSVRTWCRRNAYAAPVGDRGFERLERAGLVCAGRLEAERQWWHVTHEGARMACGGMTAPARRRAFALAQKLEVAA